MRFSKSARVFTQKGKSRLTTLLACVDWGSGGLWANSCSTGDKFHFGAHLAVVSGVLNDTNQFSLFKKTCCSRAELLTYSTGVVARGFAAQWDQTIFAARNVSIVLGQSAIRSSLEFGVEVIAADAVGIGWTGLDGSRDRDVSKN